MVSGCLKCRKTKLKMVQLTIKQDVTAQIQFEPIDLSFVMADNDGLK